MRTAAAIRPVIIGAGPAGLFCALRFLESGVTPIIIEQGKDIAERSADINRFFESGILDPESNIQFGLGGAGTFSDGKLMSRIKNPLTHYVAQKFIDFGADGSIKYLAKPHLGTDNLKKNYFRHKNTYRKQRRPFFVFFEGNRYYRQKRQGNFSRRRRQG